METTHVSNFPPQDASLKLIYTLGNRWEGVRNNSTVDFNCIKKGINACFSLTKIRPILYIQYSL